MRVLTAYLLFCFGIGAVMGAINWDRRRPAQSSGQVRAAQQLRDDTLRHTIKVGKSGSGKSYATRHEVKRNFELRRFQLILDPNGSFADDVLGDNLAAHEADIEVLDLDQPSPTWGVELFHWSDAADESQRLQDNLNEFDRFYSLLTDERDLNITQAPMHNFCKLIAQGIFARRLTPIDLRLLPYLFIPGPQQSHLIATCTYEKAIQQLLKTNDIRNEFQRQTLVGPFQRLVDPFFENLLIQALLSVPTAPWAEWMAAGKCVIVRASMETPAAVRRTVMGMLRRMTHRVAFAHFARHGRPIGNGYQIEIDEAARLKNGASEADTAAQSRKAGGGETTIWQSLPRTPEFKDYRANIHRLEVYQQADYESCLAAAEEIVAFVFDALKVKAVERRERTINRGVNHREITTRSKRFDDKGRKEGESESTHLLSVPDIESVTDEQKILASHDDQVMEWVGRIRRLNVGERLVIDGTTVSPETERVVSLEDLWKPPALKQLRIRQALDRIRSRPHYRQPDFSPPEVPPPPPPPEPRPTPRSRRGID